MKRTTSASLTPRAIEKKLIQKKQIIKFHDLFPCNKPEPRLGLNLIHS